VPSAIWSGNISFGLVTVPVERDNIADAPRHARFHAVAESARNASLIVEPPILDEPYEVSVNRNRVTYSMARGKPLTFAHYGTELRLTHGRPVVRVVPKLKMLEEPTQPAGRAPARRGVEQPKALRPKRARRRVRQ